MSKKLIIIFSTIVFLIITIYTGLWFFNKNIIEHNINFYLKNLLTTQTIKEVDYKLDVSGFPFLKIELKDLKLNTVKYFAQSKNGYEISVFSKYPLTYTAKNIVNYSKSVELKNQTFDLIFKDLETNRSINFYINNDYLKLNKQNQSFSTSLKNLSIESSIDQSPIVSLANADFVNLDFKVNNNKNNLLETASNFNLSNLQLFSPINGSLVKNIFHFQVELALKGINYKDIDLYNNSVSSNEKLVNIINSLIKNESRLLIRNLKYTDSETQFYANSKFMLDKNYNLDSTIEANFRFLQKNTLLENKLKNFLNPNKNNSYKIKISTQNGLTNFNGIKFKALNFKPN